MYERKGKDVNWVVFIQWTIKEQLWRIQLLKTSQFNKIVGEGIEESKSNEEPMLTKFPLKMSKRIASWCGSNNMVNLQTLCEWQNVLLALEKECFQLEAHLSYLLTTKNDCKIELSLVNRQQVDHNGLFQDATTKLQVFQCEVDAQNLGLENLKKPLATDRSFEIGATLVVLKALQQKKNAKQVW